MTYDVKLLDANIEHAMKGDMRLELSVGDIKQAVLEYDWTGEYFNARFIGHAPGMPDPAHPMKFLMSPIEAIQKLKSEKHEFPTDVFKDHVVKIDVNS